MKKILLLIFSCLLLFLAFSAHSQDFQRRYGDVGDDEAVGALAIPGGGYVVAGTVATDGGLSKDMFLMRLNAKGDIVWYRTYGGTGEEVTAELRATTDGYVLIGTTTSFGAFIKDAYVVRTDLNGVLLWGQTYGSASEDEGNSIVQTSDGGFFMGITTTVGSSSDMLFIKTTATGAVSWSRQYDDATAGQQRVRSVLQLPNGSYAASGDVTIAGVGTGASDWFVMRMRSNGERVWSRAYSGNSPETAEHLIHINDTSLVAMGPRSSSTTINDISILRLDTAGNQRMTAFHGDATATATDEVRWFARNTDGSYISAGNTGTDGLLMKLRANGSQEWVRVWGGPSNERFHCVVPTPDGGYLAVGSTNGYGASGTDIFVAKTNDLGIAGDCLENAGALTTRSPVTTSPAFTLNETGFVPIVLPGAASLSVLPPSSFMLCRSASSGDPCNQSTEGVDFLLGFMEQITTARELTMHMTSRFTTRGVIYVGSTFHSTFVVPASGSFSTAPLSRALFENLNSGVIQNRAVRVVTDTLISLYALDYATASSDASLIYPSKLLGDKYYPVGYHPNNTSGGWQRNSEFLVVAKEDNTVVTIKPKVITRDLRPAGTPFNVTLNKGQSYQLQSSHVVGPPYPVGQGDLSGSLVTATKPVAVFGGNYRTIIPNLASVTCCRDNIYDQMPPTQTWGRKFITVPFRTRFWDIFRIIGGYNATSVEIEGIGTITLNDGDIYEFNTNGSNTPRRITSTKPIAVMHFSTSSGADGVTNSDPFMIPLSPLNQTFPETNFVAFFSPIVGFKYYVNILAETSTVPFMVLNGASIAADFTPIAGTGYSMAQKEIPSGAYNLNSGTNPDGFIAYIYGYGNAESYGYSAGGKLEVTLDIGPDTTFCVGDTYRLDAGEGFQSYEWNGRPELNEQTLTVDTTGMYIVKAIDFSGCIRYDTAIITFEQPEVDIKHDGISKDTVRICNTAGPQLLNGCLPSYDATHSFQWAELGSAPVLGTTCSLTVSKYSDTTTYVLLVRDVNGVRTCLNRDTITVIFFPSADIQLGGISYDTIKFCNSDGVQRLNAGRPSGGFEVFYEWRQLPAGTLVSTTSILTANVFSATTFYEVSISVPDNPLLCPPKDTIAVTFYPNPVVDIMQAGVAQDRYEFCDSDGAKILSAVHPSHAGKPIRYNWYINHSYGAPVATTPTLSVFTPSSSAIYTVIIRDESDTTFCEGGDTVTVAFNTNPVANITQGGVPRSLIQVCDSAGAQTVSAIHPTHAGRATYQWRNLSTMAVVSTSGTMTVNTPSASHLYEVLVTDTAQVTDCQRRDTIRITFFPNPIAEITYAGVPRDTVQFCDSDSSEVLSALHVSHLPSTMTYTWNDLTTPTVGISNTSSLTVSNYSSTRRYEVIITDTTEVTRCARRDTITVIYNTNPRVNIRLGSVDVRSVAFCDSEGAKTFTAVGTPSTSVTYQWNNLTAGISGVSMTSTLVANNFSATTDYEVIITDISKPTNCIGRDTVQVRFNTLPTVNITHLGIPKDTVQICDSNGSQTLSALHPSHGVVQMTYSWNNLTSGLMGIGTAPALSVGVLSATTRYEVVVTDTSQTTDCVRRDTITVIFNTNPAADIRHLGVSKSLVEICNRSGAQTLTALHPTHVPGRIRYQWNNLTAGLTNISSLATLTANLFSASTLYEVIVTDTAQVTDCQRRDTIRVTFFPDPVANITYLGAPQSALEFCDRQGAQTISAAHASHGVGITYQWNNLSTGVSNIGFMPTLVANNFSTLSIYEVVITNTTQPTACVSRDTIRVRFNPMPVVDITHLGVSRSTYFFCNKDGAQPLEARNATHGTGRMTYQWNNLTAGLTNIASTSVLSANVFSNTTQYEVIVRDTAQVTDCETRDTVTVVFTPEPVVDIVHNSTTPDTIELCDLAGPQTLNAAHPSHLAGTVTYQWYKNGDFATVISSAPSITANLFGVTTTYVVAVTNSTTTARCSTRDTIVVIFNKNPTVDIRHLGVAADTFRFCNREGAQTLNASHPTHTGSFSYEWRNLTAGGAIVGATSTFSAAGFTASTLYEVTVKDLSSNLDCETRDTVLVIFSPNPTGFITHLGVSKDTVLACNSDGPQTLQATSVMPLTASFKWFRNGTFMTGATGSSVAANNFALGGVPNTAVYVLEIKDLSTPKQCAHYDTIRVIFSPAPALSLPDITIVCDTVGKVRTDLTGMSYAWTGPMGFTATTQEITVENEQEGWFYLTVTNPLTGCKSRDSSFVRFFKPPKAIIRTSALYACAGKPITLYGKHFTHTSGVRYQWSTGATTDSIVVTGTGSVSITLTVIDDSTTCKSTDTKVIEFTPNPVIVLPDVIRICPKDSIGQTLTPGFAYQWTGAGIVKPDSIHRVILVNKEGFYTVTMINPVTGCSSKKTVFVQMNTPPKVGLRDTALCNSQKPYRMVAEDLTHGTNIKYRWFNALSPTVSIGTGGVLSVAAAGTYIVNVTDSLTGCVSRDTATVVFNPDPNFSIVGYDGPLCQGRDTLSVLSTNLEKMTIRWFGPGIMGRSDTTTAVVTQTGTYTVVVTDTSQSTRCQTIKSITVFINLKPIIKLSKDTVVCDRVPLVLDVLDASHVNNVTYVWRDLRDGSVLSDSSRVVLEHSSMNNPSYAPIPVEITITNGLSSCFTKDTISVKFDRSASASIDKNISEICLGESLLLKASGGTRFLWTTGDTTESFMFKPDTAGLYYFGVQTDYRNICSAATEDFYVFVAARPTANLPDSVVICENGELILDGFNFKNPFRTTYSWKLLETNAILSDSSVYVVKFEDYNTYDQFRIEFTAQDSSAGCPYTDTVLVKFDRRSEVEILENYPREICIGSPLTLTATGGTSYLWNTQDTTATVTITPKRIGLQRFIVSARFPNDCNATADTVYVMVNPLPKIQAHFLDTVNICADASVTLIPSGGVSYEWKHDPLLRGSITVTPKKSTTYYVIGTDDNGCTNIDSVFVRITPTIDLGPDLQRCAGDVVTIGQVSEVPAKYLWLPGGDTTATIDVNETGRYEVVVTVDSCVYKRSVFVDFKPYPLLKLVTDTTLCFELSADENFSRTRKHTLRYELLNRSDSVEYILVWLDKDSSIVAIGDSLEIEDTGVYYLKVMVMYPYPCLTSDSIQVGEICPPRIFVPTAFTPNKDELNDRFKVFGKHIDRFAMTVYNRWNEVVYRMDVPDFDAITDEQWWNGQFKDKDAMDGVYFWTISYRTSDVLSDGVDEQKMTGSFTLIR
ncbi:MAG: gliding motility-associated C-terminal domain-containing protein [Cytophagales bacterium]|nr:MAG: gliding motility-associated C-terminal domain-containing protein [Cytophagales bacterium]